MEAGEGEGGGEDLQAGKPPLLPVNAVADGRERLHEAMELMSDLDKAIEAAQANIVEMDSATDNAKHKEHDKTQRCTEREVQVEEKSGGEDKNLLERLNALEAHKNELEVQTFELHLNCVSALRVHTHTHTSHTAPK
jgi:hypothetical protein